MFSAAVQWARAPLIMAISDMRFVTAIFKHDLYKRRWFFGSVILGLTAVLCAICFMVFFSATRLALVGYSDFQMARFAKVNDSGWLSIEALSLNELDRSSDYDVILLFGRGLSLDATQKSQLDRASTSGTALYVAAQMHEGINVTNVSAEQAELLGQYLRFGGDANSRNLLSYLRHEIDEKTYGMLAPEDPKARSGDVLFHLKDDQVFTHLKEYQTFYERLPSYGSTGKKVAVLTSVPGPFNANRDHLDSLIEEIESRGMRVYPIASHSRRLKILQELQPDLVVFMPHGRLHRGTGKETVDWFKQQNIPMFSPLSVFERHDKWLEDAQGFSGGMLTMNVVMPEFDGGILPTVINAQFVDDNGFQIFKSVEGRMPRFVDQMEQWLQLKHQSNSDKKLAIVYFRGPGKNALVAGNMEVAPSLYNTLQDLQQRGYNLTGLPETLTQFKALLAQQGQVMTPYAPGLEADFLRQGNPALIDAEVYKKWCEEKLPEGRCEKISAVYGEAPGRFMTTKHNGKTQIGVARLTFGNVAILPQPLPGLGENTFQLIHGADKAPPHSYAAVYLWIREAFDADAIMHFGTHGSLEFTPSKQVALSGRDWSDALLGDLPHFYVYTVGNVGEAIIAKRRSYATIVSHLTPPFQESGLYSELKRLDELLKSFSASQGEIRNELRRDITALAKSIDLDKDLALDIEIENHKQWDEIVYPKLSEWLEIIAQASITEGLYSIGKAYSSSQADRTAMLMVVDALIETYKKMMLLVPSSIVEPAMTTLERETAKHWAERVLSGVPSDVILSEYFPTKLHHLLRGGADATSINPSSDDRVLAAQLFMQLENYLGLVPQYQKHLLAGTEAELNSLSNGLFGGYIEPSSGGDPIVNPQSLPTGRNMYSIDAERTPSSAGWALGKSMAQALVERHQKETGDYPKKVSFTLWPSEFIHTQGATLGQIFYLLGVEPVRDPFDRVLNLRLIDRQQLGRPRIDVVVQSAGQFRDLAASRLALIEKAVTMAAAAPASTSANVSMENYVAQGARAAELYLLDKGLPPAKARALSTRRSFGGLNGAYGTGIMGMVEASESWRSESEIAQQYIHNMGANYGDEEQWGDFEPHLFSAALLNTDVVVQPRSSNTWGALSLDHVYEFMGGLNMAVRSVTGKDPAAYFSDYRNPNKARLQSHNEAVWEEARTTLLNPKYIRDMSQGGASSAETFAESLRNTFGWNVMKPEGIDDSLWNQLHDVYIRDKHELDLKAFFERENPYALQEFTGVMLEASRKKLWLADDRHLAELAQLHAQLVADHEAGCGGFTCGNKALQKYINNVLSKNSEQIELMAKYQQKLYKAQTNPEASEALVLKKQESIDTKKVDDSGAIGSAESEGGQPSEEQKTSNSHQSKTETENQWRYQWFIVLLLLTLVLAAARLIGRRRG